MFKPALLALTLSLASPVWAYGTLGHEVIATLAEPYLEPQTRQAINKLIPDESLADIAWWTDQMRNSQRGSTFWSYDHSSSWHFVNVPPDQEYNPDKAAPEGDIVQAINAFTGILEDSPPVSGPIYEGLKQYQAEFPDLPDPFTDKALALRFLVHFIADIHQPLHVGYGADSGGNAIEVEWFGRKTNLHSVWDTQLVRSLAANTDALNERLEREMNWVSDDEFRGAANSTVDDWVNEGLRIRTAVYDSVEDGDSLATNYAKAYETITRNQLLKAAIRTAATLNAVFAAP